MDMLTERPRTAGRIAPTGRLTPNQSRNGGRRKAIPVPPPRVPTPMPTANSNPQKINSNVIAHPTVTPNKKEPHENISKIAKRYLDDNMQQTWINPRLISMINMKAVTSTDYSPTTYSRGGANFSNYTGYSDYIHYGEKYEYNDESTKPGPIPRSTLRHTQDNAGRHGRSHSQPERARQSSHDARSKSQDSSHIKFQRIDKLLPNTTELTFYEIDGPKVRETRISQLDRTERRDKTSMLMRCGFGRGGRVEQKTSFIVDDQLRYQPEPPKYQLFEKPPRYQEANPKVEPPPKYHPDPPKYSDILKKQEEEKQQEERARRASYYGGNGGGGGQLGSGGASKGAAYTTEPPANLASITPVAREVTRAGTASTRHIQSHKNNVSDGAPSEELNKIRANADLSDKPKGTVDVILKPAEGQKMNQKVTTEKSEKMKSAQDSAFGKYKSDNIKYYGELKGYDFKSYGNIDKPVTAHERSHQHGASGHEVGGQAKSFMPKSAQDKGTFGDKLADHYHHRAPLGKPPLPPYQETKYSYNVNGTPGTIAQVNAAAVFFARAAQKLNPSASPAHRRRRSGDENISNEQPISPNGYAALLLKSPPPAPPALLRRIGVKELSGVGKVKVMLRVSSGEGGSFFNADKRKKQITLIDPASAQSSTAEDRRPTVAAPKMFAFDAIFTEEDSQTEICSSALTDVIHAVINGTDGCLFCFGHAGLGKSHTMLGTPEAGHTLGAIPCAIAWLFRGISEQRQRTGARFSVRVSCVELTTGQQQLRDLLAAYANDSEQSPSIYLRDDPLFGALQLQQCSELRAPTAERAAFYLDSAVSGRQREDGDAHMLYTLHVYQYSVAGKGGVAGGRSRLHLMDLGNSDRGKSSGGIPLSGLGNILIAIFNGQKHLPYKDHKLTQLLKECLGSLTCHAAMIAHVSPNAAQYSETLTTVQLASRIHRMRRRKIRFLGGITQGNGSGGSSGEEQARQNSECDPSSSDLSADTVIYVGPSADDATDGEHPPVYIPSMNSGDNRCAMGRILRGSVAERPSKIPEERSPAHKTNKSVKTLQMASKQTSPAHSITPKASPARKMSNAKASNAKVTDSPNSKIPVPTASGGSDEHWIDGPRISKSKVAEARHLLKDHHHKRETWIDGPMQLSSSSLHHCQQHTSGYGFMDSHKKSMIKKWVENQSSHIQRTKHLSNKPETKSAPKEMPSFKQYEDDNVSVSTAESDSIKANEIEDITDRLGAKLNLLNVKSNTDSGLDLTASPILDDRGRTKANLEEDDDDEEIVVPPPLPLIEPLSNTVSREVSMESLNLSHKDIALPSQHSICSEDEILEIVEVEDLEPVPMQDSCLQVTEEDIALCMGENPLPESDQEEHPLRILSQENLTIVSTFTDSMSVMSDSERYRSHYAPHMSSGMLPRPYFDHEDFLEQESRHKFDQLARLHELYQSKLALANVSNSVTYQRENSSASVRDASSGTLFRPPSRCQSLSLSDVFINDTASNHGSIYSEPTYAAADKSDQEKICDNCRQSMSRPSTASYWYPSSVSHLSSPKRYCAKLGDCNISNLRHPDGASNPNLKEEIERIPGNGASGSDPEEEYIEVKKLFVHNVEKNERTVTGKSDIEEDRSGTNNVAGNIPLEISIPSSIPSSGKMQRKILSLGSSYGLNKDGYDSGADSTPRAAKLSPATLSRHRAESSGYDSVVRDSETSSIGSDSSRQTSALPDHQSGALGVLTSTLCGCFSGGTTSSRVRATASRTAEAGRVDPRLLRRGRGYPGQARPSTNSPWQDVQDTPLTSTTTTT